MRGSHCTIWRHARLLGLSALVFVLLCGIASAQNYSLVPRGTYLQGTLGGTESFLFDITNLTTDSQTVIIHHYAVNMPDDWTHSICTGVQCLPPSVDMIPFTLPPNASDSITLDVYSYSAGTGVAGVFIFQDRSADSVRIQCTVMVPTSQVAHEATPISFSISSVYPNPFNSNTKVRFSLPQSGMVKLTMYDELGRTLAQSGKEFAPGTNEIALGNWFTGLSSGLYFIRIETPFEQRTHRIEYIR